METDSRPKLRLLKTSKCFGGFNKRYEYDSECCGWPIKFVVFFPPAAAREVVPVVYYLASMTTNDETFPDQAGAQRKAAELGVALVCTDNSPRDVPGIENQGTSPVVWKYGYSNSWYLNATEPRFRNWQMRQWVGQELPQVVRENFPQLNAGAASIMGFSMGGHGALTIGLAFPDQYRCISALAPVCNPASSGVGQTFFGVALGPDKEEWKKYDAIELVAAYKGPFREILIDKGTLEENTVVDPQKFAAIAAANPNVRVRYREQEGYNHSFPFVATFVDEHLEWHLSHLNA